MTPIQSHTSDGLLLPGLDGTNPLGFLAALGVLRTLDMQSQGELVRMQWQRSRRTWLPRIHNGGRDIDDLLNRLAAGFNACDPTPWTINKKLPFEAERLRNEVLDATAAASLKCRDRVDTLGSFGVESISDKEGIFKDTSLRMIRAGDSVGNGLLAYGKQIQDQTTPEDLRSALTESWKYEDEKCALRWDPAEYHGYALQWTNPSKESTVSVRGGNRLALAAMPLLSTIPRNGKVETVAFARPDDQNECMSWPLWNVSCSLDVVRSLLTIARLPVSQPNRIDLHQRGIDAIYRCDRIKTSTYYRNFTPAQRIA